MGAAALVAGLALVVFASVAGADETAPTGPTAPAEPAVLLVDDGEEVTAQDPAPPSTSPANWSGNGTNKDGTCESFEDDDKINAGPGQQGWLFILNGVNPNTPWSMTATFNPGGTVNGTLVNTNNQTLQFVAYSSAGAALTSATATYNGAGTGEWNNFVVSHCEVGPPTTTTTEAPTTTTEAPTTTTEVGPTVVTQGPGPTTGATGAQQLPRTGAFSLPLFLSGLALMIGGAVALRGAGHKDEALSEL